MANTIKALTAKQAKAKADAAKAAKAKAAAAAKKAAAYKRNTVPDSRLPGDYLKGSKQKLEKYTAWKTEGGGKPDLGKGSAGPGNPYREVQKTMVPTAGKWVDSRPKPKPQAVTAQQGAVWRRWNNPQTAPKSGSPGRQFGNPDAKTKAIARRLNNG